MKITNTDAHLHTLVAPSTQHSNQLSKTVLERIGVQAPYFALQELRLNNDTCSATAYAELPTFYEQGPMAASELGRHAAILGSSHAALEMPLGERRFFLAREAECQYVASKAAFESPVAFHSKILNLSKRALSVEVKADYAGSPLAAFQITYTILPQATFKRLFSPHAQATTSKTNPYTQPLSTTFKQGDNWLEQSIENVSPSACVGHFASYPALPVAVIMGQLSYLAGQLTRKPYRVSAGSVKAEGLCWAGQDVRFRVERESVAGLKQTFVCQAFANDKVVAQMHLTLELLD